MIDLLILGGGPAGYVAAERAAHHGLSVLLFEKKALGGVCLNEGCIPTKTLLYSAKVFDSLRHGDKYGVTGDNLRFDYAKMVARKDKVVRRLVAGVESTMKLNNVQVVKGEAYILGPCSQGFALRCNDTTYQGQNLLICTGSEAFIPPIEGLSDSMDFVLTNRELLALKERPDSLVVVGGGVIGMEFASFYNSLGTSVTVIEMQPEILNGMDAEQRTALREVYTRKGIQFHLGAQVVRVEGGLVHFVKEGQHFSVQGAKILMSVGRKAVTGGFGLENLNVKLGKNGILVNERMETSAPGVYAAGDVTGFSLLAHTASREGEVVANNLIGCEDSMKYDAIPGVVYTNPEAASVGLTEQQALEQDKQYKVVKLPMSFSGRFVAENEGVNGFCKVLVNETDKTLLGVHLLGNPSSELIFGACLCMEQKMTLEQLQKVVFPHPTVSEILRESAFS